MQELGSAWWRSTTTRKRSDGMDRFVAFEHAAVKARMKRLRQAQVDLQRRLDARKVQAEAEGRWVPSDPMYQRLASVLRQVRNDLRETGNEHARRTEVSERESVAAA
jgi:hypothetical protein